jgi:DNA (cytosine-5)-methyltransferase 1
MKLRVFTAFAGYDSQLLALQRLHRDYPDFEFECVGWSEIDRYAIAAHNGIFPELSEKNYGDITQIDWASVPDFDLLTWSFPCTNISSAGKQAGLSAGSGTSSSLCWDCLRGIEIKRPKYLLMENVKALTQKKFMPEFLKIQRRLESFGYKNFWQVINARDHGIPQNRERVFMMSILDANATFTFPAPYELKKRLGDVLEKNVPESYYLSEKQVSSIVAHCDRKVAEGCGFKTNFTPPTESAELLRQKKARESTIPTSSSNVKVAKVPPNYGSSRLNKMIADGKIDRDKTLYIDAYNQQTYEGVNGTILTRVDRSNHYFVSEPRMIQKVGDRGTTNYSVKDVSFTIPANPMSDRGQLLIEKTESDGAEDNRLHEG